ACRRLGTPVIGGNVSLYNESEAGPIHPTPVIGMVGLVRDVDHITTQPFKREGDVVILLGETKAELGGSEFQFVIHGVTEGRPPQIDLDQEKTLQDALLEAIRSGWIASAHDLSEGGLAVALAECCITGGLGAEVALETDLRPDIALFSESQSRVILSVRPEHAEEVLRHFRAKGVPAAGIGTVKGTNLAVRINGNLAIDVPVERLTRVWKDAIPCRMR